jgi:hypothetical protein
MAASRCQLPWRLLVSVHVRLDTAPLQRSRCSPFQSRQWAMPLVAAAPV